MYNVNDVVNINELKWISDYNGYELGFDDVLVCGYYADNGPYEYMVDMESHKVLEKYPLLEDPDYTE